MPLELSRSGKWYTKSKNLVLVFTEREKGYVVTAIERRTEQSIGYVFLSYFDLEKLLSPPAR